MSLKDVQIKKEYRSPRDDIVNDFYVPLLKEATLYKRSVGFFSSSSFIEISYGLSKLISNQGTIQLIVSPHLSEEDIEAINKGYEIRENVIERAMLRHIIEPQTYFEKERLNLLANLIAQEKLDIKIAFSCQNNKLGLYHEKLGILHDSNENIIAFSGSLNETGSAFSYNYETIDVFTSWNDYERVYQKETAFDNLWNNRDMNAQVYDFPETVNNKLKSYKKDVVNYNIDDEEPPPRVLTKGFSSLKKSPNSPKMPESISLYEYQINAIEAWKKHGFQGIFDMATGTGKTFTGLGAIVELYKHLNGRLAVIIVCPYQHLVNQWVEDIVDFNIKPIIGHSSSSQTDFKRKIKMAIIDYNLKVSDFFCFICTNATFATSYIQEKISNVKGDALLIVDEAHNFGAMNLQKTLTDIFNCRLALSATLERHGDIEGTRVLTDYFGKKCITFSLEDAIGKFLTPYKYYPIMVYLSVSELEQYNILSREIGKNIIKENGKTKLSSKGKIIAQQRARLVAGAINKIQILKNIITPFKNENHILVYCGATKIDEYDNEGETLRQIDAITDVLGNELEIRVSQFTSNEDAEKREILRRKFAEGNSLQALIAIKCLDEGVNIPSIKTAFILASTTNPKEYIQRRGRVLRKFPGKEFAVIYDFITLPRPLEDVVSLTKEEIRYDKTLVKNELNRIIEFKRLAMNPRESDELINEIRENYLLWEDKIKFEEEQYE